MMKKRGLAIMISAFAIVLLAGVAVAQITDVLPGNDRGDREAPSLAAPDTDDDSGRSERASEALATAAAEPLETVGPGSDQPVATTEEAPTTGPPGEAAPAEAPKADEPKDDAATPADDEEDEPDTTPPAFVILSPEDGSRVDDEVIEVSGEVEPGAKVTFAGRYRADVADDGRWWIALKLEPGENVFTLVATDASGNTSRASVTVYHDAKTDHRFTANQKWEQVDGSPAANKYYGTGTPGAHVWIVSERGGAEQKVVVGDNGEWFAHVEFPKAPCDERFTVVVEADEFRRAFEMKWVCPDSAEIDFTANQKYGSCGETVPYDVFWGTEDAGAKIVVSSKYGSAWTKADDGGSWELRVEFPGAPIGKTFEVVVESSDGGRKVFTFTRTAPADE
jgi:hypothetical protein